MRLLGKIHRETKVISLRALETACKGQFDDQPPPDVALELVAFGYLVQGADGWRRTKKPYSQDMRRTLAAIAQNRKKFDRTVAVVTPVAGIEPELARWFGYPTAPVYLTGRVFLMKGRD